MCQTDVWSSSFDFFFVDRSLEVNVNKVNDKVNDIYSIHSHYKGNHKRCAAAGGRGTSFVVAANGRHLCIGFE